MFYPFLVEFSLSVFHSRVLYVLLADVISVFWIFVCLSLARLRRTNVRECDGMIQKRVVVVERVWGRFFVCVWSVWGKRIKWLTGLVPLRGAVFRCARF